MTTAPQSQKRTWSLFARFIGRAGRKPVLIEWDTDVPDYAVLLAEAAKAEAIMREQASFAPLNTPSLDQANVCA